MKNFKQILSEANEMERLSLKSVGYKSWITPKGKAINLNNHDALFGDYHHVHKVVDSPKLFGTTSKELQELDPVKYPYLVHNNHLGYRKENWSTPILRDLGKRGYIRVSNQSFESGHDMIHDFKLSNHGYEGRHSIESFLPALKKVRDTIAKTQMSKKDSISVRLFGMDGMKDKFTRHFQSLAHIDDFLTKQETTDKPRRSTDPLPVVPRHFSSTQTRQLLSKTPPEGTNIPQAIWNNMRTIGDSYDPLKSFKDYINEDLGDTSQGLRKLTKYINKAKIEQSAFDIARRVYFDRASSKEAIEPVEVNIQKAFQMKRKADNRAAGLERAIELRKSLKRP